MASLPPAAENLGHRVNALVVAGKIEEACEAAVTCVQMIMDANETPGSRVVVVTMRPMAEMGVAARAHLRCTCEWDKIGLEVPCEIATTMFTNWMDGFVCIRTVLDAPAMQVALGYGIIDIEDASNSGDYLRFAFGSARSDAVLNVDAYWVKYKGYAETRAAIEQNWIDWTDRADNVLWRGSMTGLRRQQSPESSSTSPWWSLQRLYLCDVAARSHWRERLDVGITAIAELATDEEREAIHHAGFLKPMYPKINFLGHRHIIDIDGNANAWNGCFEALLMGATVLKVASPFGWKQWYYNQLVPWEHFVPVDADLSDFDDVIEWTMKNPVECARIGCKARSFAKEMSYDGEVSLASERLATMLALALS